MQALFLTRRGNAATAFQLRDAPMPVPATGQVLIQVQGFGLNFADVMARKGMYKDAPPIPAILGYDVCGIITEVGKDVTGFAVGDRVTALTRFDGYAQYAVADARACMKIADDWDVAQATALATQYCTAYYCAAEMVQLYSGDKVLIHAAAGGVGAALAQYCLHSGCEVFGTAGSDEKTELLKQRGIQYPINYRKEPFDATIRSITGGKGVDVIFDSIGASYFKKGVALLAPGGRIVGFGAADMDSNNIFKIIKGALAFGFYHPAQFLTTSRSMLGVNMLKVADEKPEIIQRCFTGVKQLLDAGVFHPMGGKIFKSTEIGAAHHYLESRQSTGKVAVEWV